MRPITPTLLPAAIQPQFQAAIRDAINQAEEFHELVVTDVPQGCCDILWEADEPLLSHPRLSYDPATSALRLSIMVTWTYNRIEWLADAKPEWVLNGITDRVENKFFRVGQYNARIYERPISRAPKAAWCLHIRPLFNVPHFTVESGFSESYDDLLNDMNRLLVGGNGDIQAVILVKWTRRANSQVDGFLEVYKRDRQGMPQLQQRKIIFHEPAGNPPQPLNFTRREICGGQVQAGRVPTTILPLLRDLLFARNALARQGLIPAINGTAGRHESGQEINPHDHSIVLRTIEQEAVFIFTICRIERADASIF
ncbi:hypothetical protein N7461_008039 [Penicillium sp. DV-2018c]|nr:hypothetical protein N7461_008039 [Penicillium sp. DV-2018c]